MLSNQTSTPLSVWGTGLKPGMTLALTGAATLQLPLTVLDASHAFARLPAGIEVAGGFPEGTLNATVPGASGAATLTLVNDTHFPDLVALAASPDGATLFAASTPEDRLYTLETASGKVSALPTGDGPTALAVWTDAGKKSWVVVAHRFSPELTLWPIGGGAPRSLPAPASASALRVRGGVAFVAEQATDSVTALSLADGGRVLWRVPVGPNPDRLELAGQALAVGCAQSGEVEWRDPATGALLSRSAPGPGAPIVGGRTAAYSKWVMGGSAARALQWSPKLGRLFAASIGPNVGPNPDKMEVSMNGGVDVLSSSGFVRHLGFGAGVTQALALDDARGLLYAADVALGVVRVLDAKKLAASDEAAAHALLQELALPVPPGFPRVREAKDFGTNGRAGESLHAGPQALVLSPSGDALWVLDRFTGTLARLDVRGAARGAAEVKGASVLVDPLEQRQRRLGQILYFADLGRSGMSCDACHAEGHTGGVLFEKTEPLRVYRVPTVRGSRESPPYFTPASTHSMAETAKVVGGRNRFHNPDPSASEIEQLTMFASLIPTLPNPFVGPDGAPVTSLTLPDGAVGNPREGLKLFEGKAACAGCHPGPQFTTDQDPPTRGRYLDVGTPHLMPLREKLQNPFFGGFAPPALVGSWDVFPMLTTGLAGLEVTDGGTVRPSGAFALRQAVEGWAGTHGRADLLTAQEKNDLLAYVMSL